MDDVQLKFNLLDVDSKKEVLDFIDSLIAKMKAPKNKNSSYKKQILGVSTWTDDDIKFMEETTAN
jgi:hypothetical protein